MNIAVIFAGGIGSRINILDKPKQFLDICGKPVIIWTLEHFESHPMIDAIVIACIKDWIPYLNDLLVKFKISKVKKIVPGGATGQLSIYNGLLAAKEISNNDDSIVLIHDVVRPLINEKLITDNIRNVIKKGNSITCSDVKETFVEINDNNQAILIPKRKSYKIAKAPQCFYLKDILNAHEKAIKDGINDFIDSCTMMKYYDYDLFLTDGPYENIKITTINDFYVAKIIIETNNKNLIR